VHGWIVILHAAIVAGADESSLFIENGGAMGMPPSANPLRASAMATASMA
jgi:hypothetical protein